MGRPVIFDVRRVSKAFKENVVLSDVSFKVYQGEVIGLIGASGAGKTTLLNLIVGFLAPDRGSVHFTYRPPGKKERTYNVLDKPLLVSKQYGFAAQNPSFYERLSVRENMEYFAHLYGLGGHAIRANIDVLLRLMNLKASQHIMARDLSGGMKRRLDIACALVHHPEVLILDEPTADLDPVLRNQIWEVVKRINARGTTVILSSHHLNELDTLCNRIAIVKDGGIADLDTPDRLKLKHHRIQEVLVESYPGNYERLIDDMKRADIITLERRGAYLKLRTEEPQRILKQVLTLLEKHGEQLLDIRLNKPNLDDVFVTLYTKDALEGKG